MKAIVVVGSESGTAKRNIDKVVAGWREGGAAWTVLDVLEGNAAAREGLASLAKRCDALLIATSSFRQGDAPFNYDDFLGALYRGAGTAVLEGCQHAVLGFGDSHFDTYMNCPRLSDMLLEKCGSRRLAQRREIDVREKAKGLADVAAWAAAVDAALAGGCGASDEPSNAWTVPGNGQTYDKSLEYAGEDPAPAGGGGVPWLAVAGVGVVAAAAYFYMA